MAVGVAMGPGAILAGGLIFSLILMGASRKVFGPDVVGARLVPHRKDIGVSAFFSIGFGMLAGLNLIETKYATGGQLPAIAQVGYVMSLIDRGDLPPKHPHRLVFLLVVWLVLAFGSAHMQIAAQVASLWIVKLRLAPASRLATHGQPESTAGKSASAAAIKLEEGVNVAPFIKPKRRATSPTANQKKKKPSKPSSKRIGSKRQA